MNTRQNITPYPIVSSPWLYCGFLACLPEIKQNQKCEGIFNPTGKGGGLVGQNQGAHYSKYLKLTNL